MFTRWDSLCRENVLPTLMNMKVTPARTMNLSKEESLKYILQHPLYPHLDLQPL